MLHSLRSAGGPMRIAATASDHGEVFEARCTTNSPSVGALDYSMSLRPGGVLALPASRMKSSVLSLCGSFWLTRLVYRMLKHDEGYVGKGVRFMSTVIANKDCSFFEKGRPTRLLTTKAQA
jgi:hypothetical protein